ncbi:unnamed protein product, partial [marine sediment metagenome]
AHMDREDQDIEALDGILSAGDAWLRKFGVVSSAVIHNNIVLNLYSHFPQVRLVEYFMPEDPADRKIDIILYLGFWKLFFTNKDQLLDDVFGLIKEYLDNYQVQITLKRYKPQTRNPNKEK